ncbi:unnamed protein product [Cuscuta epithymum]|uniref:Uncharacterized protein n=1 Tax=Cuscuta epithymum TaxID=186058 RepID=A0AAV0DCV3_9ASTE|nr:unnamed protein product [Cuscuta epithymum]
MTPSGKGHGRSLWLKAGTDLNSRSYVIGGKSGGSTENVMNKRHHEEETIVPPTRPPPELPPEYQKQIGGSGTWLEVVLWKKEQEFYFIVFLPFNVFDHNVCFCFWYVSCCKTVDLDVVMKGLC